MLNSIFDFVCLQVIGSAIDVRDLQYMQNFWTCVCGVQKAKFNIVMVTTLPLSVIRRWVVHTQQKELDGWVAKGLDTNNNSLKEIPHLHPTYKLFIYVSIKLFLCCCPLLNVNQRYGEM